MPAADAAPFRPSAPVLCPVVIGRDGESEALLDRLTRVQQGAGGVVGAVGEAGAGKTRLCQLAVDEARARGMVVLAGRAVPSESPVPYRPLTEAFAAAFRAAPPPETPALVGFGGQLGRLVPAWGGSGAGGADESPVLLGEAVVRLLRLLGRDDGCLMLLEDLHWADSETLAVVDYLADAVRDERVLVLFNTRPGGAADELLPRLQRRDPSALLAVEPLRGADVERVVAACLADDRPPPDLVSFIDAHSEGNPFLIEELLAGLVASGALAKDGATWATTDLLKPTVPFSFGDSIRRRLAILDDDARRALDAAAVLGRRFEWELLPGVAELDASAAVAGLRRGIDEQLIEVDGNDFKFRHALTREAVLAEMLPPVRQALSRRARPAIELAHPGLPGAWCDLAAELAEASGERSAAAKFLVTSARRALARGALTSAGATAARARPLAEGEALVVDDTDEVLVEILTAAGKPQDALAIGAPLLERFTTRQVPADRQVALLIVLARAAVLGGDLPTAAAFTDRAAALVDAGGVSDEVVPRLEAMAAHIALEQVRLEDAERLARAAIDGAARTRQPEVECEALEVVGRVARLNDYDAGVSWFQRSAEVAERNGLTTWLLRARQELASVDWMNGRTGPYRETRELAERNGALVTVAYMDLGIADAALASFDRDGCLEAAQGCVDASRRYGLAALPVAELWLAGAHALFGDDGAMEAAAARALERDPHDPRILGDLWGRVRATAAMVHNDRDRMRDCLEEQMIYARVAPVTTSVFPNRIMRALVSTIDDDDFGKAARAELATNTNLRLWPFFDISMQQMEAIAAGRARRHDEASARFDAAWRVLRDSPIAQGTVAYSHLLGAESALRDGWGDPATWVRGAEAFFTEHGYDEIARACRAVLAGSGAPVPRRSRASTDVPAGLRALGVTSREFDVLRLVAEGLSNREIGERLFLSPRTVERHVASLFDRTGIRNRTDLAAAFRTQDG